MHITMKKELWTKEIRYEVENNPKNVIEIDSDYSDDILPQQ